MGVRICRTAIRTPKQVSQLVYACTATRPEDHSNLVGIKETPTNLFLAMATIVLRFRVVCRRRGGYFSQLRSIPEASQRDTGSRLMCVVYRLAIVEGSSGHRNRSSTCANLAKGTVGGQNELNGATLSGDTATNMN